MKRSLRRKKVKWARPAVTPYRGMNIERPTLNVEVEMKRSRVGLDGLGPPTCPPGWAVRMERG